MDILGYLKNNQKNAKFGRVRQVPIRELGWEFDEALAAAQRYESNQKVLNKGSARVMSSTSGEQEKFGSQQGTQEPPARAKGGFQQQAETLEKLKNITQGRQGRNASVQSGQGP